MSSYFFSREYDLTVLGEIYAELSSPNKIAESSTFNQSIGGTETYTAVTAARAGSFVQYISAVARDPFQSAILRSLDGEGINTDNIVATSGYNGIYFLEEYNNDSREYLYHRPGNAVNSITPDIVDDHIITQTRVLFSSSEFQSISKECRQTVFKAFYSAHTNNTTVAYDPNLRLQRWSIDDAREAVWGIMPFIDIMFPSTPDESKALFGYDRPVDVIGFLWDRGVNIVVVKDGANGCMVGYDGKLEKFTYPSPSKSVKHLALIGGVFNGAFLSSIASGYDPFTAGKLAVEIATQKGMEGIGIKSIPKIG